MPPRLPQRQTGGLADAAIPGFRIESAVGADLDGTMLYRATAEDTGEECTIRLAPATDAALAGRLKRDGGRLAGLEHPSIPPVLGMGETDDATFVAAGEPPGRSLAVGIESGLPRTQALRMLAEVAGGLDAAHGAGLLHRRLSPATIAVGRWLIVNPVLTGFALGRDPAAFDPGPDRGQLPYASPEELRGEPAGPAADRYALACIVFELLTGAPPFGTTAGSTLEGHLHSAPPPPSSHGSGLPEALDAVLARGLAKDPGDRQPTSAELLSLVLRALSDGDDGALTVPGEALAAAETEPEPRAGAKPTQEPEPEPELTQEPESQLEPEPEPEPELTQEPESQPEPEPEPEPEEEEPEPEPEAAAEPPEPAPPPAEPEKEERPGRRHVVLDWLEEAHEEEERPAAPGSALSPAAERRPRRWKLAAPSIPAAVVAVMAAGLAGLLLGRALDSDDAPPPQRAAAGPLSVELPEGWSPSRAAPRLGNLELEGPLSVGRGAAGGMVAGLIRGEGATRDPATVARSVAGSAPAPTVVRVGPLEAYRWRGLRAGSATVDLYVAPTSAGALAIACHATTGAIPAGCDVAAGGVRLAGARSFSPVEGARWRERVRTAMDALRARRAAGQTRLAEATTAERQSREATGLARAHAAGVSELTRQPAPPQAAGAERGVLEALRAVDRAYRGLARAARAYDLAGYSRAASEVRRRHDQLVRALRPL